MKTQKIIPLFQPVNGILFMLLFALTIGAALQLPADAAEQTEEVTAFGVSPITGANLAAAKQKAIDDALKNALMKAVGDLVPLPAAVERLQPLTDQVFAKSGAFIRDYKVLSEGRSEGAFSVAITASILKEELKQSLSAAGLEGRETPGKGKKLLAIVSGLAGLEQAIKQSARESVIPLGLTLEGPEQATYDTGKIGVLTWSDIGRQRQADYLAVISARNDCEKPGADLNRCGLSGSIRIIDVPDKTLIDHEDFAIDNQTAGASPSNSSVESVFAAKLNDIMARSFDKALLNKAAGAATFKIILLDVRNYRQYELVRQTIRDNLPGVTDVRLDSAGAAKFTLAVKYRGSIDELESELLKQPFPQFQLTPAQRTQESVTFNIKK